MSRNKHILLLTVVLSACCGGYLVLRNEAPLPSQSELTAFTGTKEVRCTVDADCERQRGEYDATCFTARCQIYGYNQTRCVYTQVDEFCCVEQSDCEDTRKLAYFYALQAEQGNECRSKYICGANESNRCGIPNLEGKSCDDGSSCTNDDVCSAGSCGGQLVECEEGNYCRNGGCIPIGACSEDSDCPQSACQTHVCLSDGTCSQAIDHNGDTCDDGNVNTINDQCSAGSCYGEPCPSGATDTGSGECECPEGQELKDGTCQPEDCTSEGCSCAETGECDIPLVCDEGTCVSRCHDAGDRCKPANGCYSFGCDDDTGACEVSTYKCASNEICDDSEDNPDLWSCKNLCMNALSRCGADNKCNPETGACYECDTWADCQRKMPGDRLYQVECVKDAGPYSGRCVEDTERCSDGSIPDSFFGCLKDQLPESSDGYPDDEPYGPPEAPGSEPLADSGADGGDGSNPGSGDDPGEQGTNPGDTPAAPDTGGLPPPPPSEGEIESGEEQTNTGEKGGVKKGIGSNPELREQTEEIPSIQNVVSVTCADKNGKQTTYPVYGASPENICASLKQTFVSKTDEPWKSMTPVGGESPVQTVSGQQPETQTGNDMFFDENDQNQYHYWVTCTNGVEETTHPVLSTPQNLQNFCTVLRKTFVSAIKISEDPIILAPTSDGVATVGSSKQYGFNGQDFVVGGMPWHQNLFELRCTEKNGNESVYTDAELKQLLRLPDDATISSKTENAEALCRMFGATLRGVSGTTSIPHEQMHAAAGEVPALDLGDAKPVVAAVSSSSSEIAVPVSTNVAQRRDGSSISSIVTVSSSASSLSAVHSSSVSSVLSSAASSSSVASAASIANACVPNPCSDDQQCIVLDGGKHDCLATIVATQLLPDEGYDVAAAHPDRSETLNESRAYVNVEYEDCEYVNTSVFPYVAMQCPEKTSWFEYLKANLWTSHVLAW